MCGFNGVVGEYSPDNINDLKQKSLLIEHRGPDEYTNLKLDNIYVDFFRLSIVDIKNGSQPKSDLEGKYTLFFNGEIYNFKQLKEELIDHGLDFQTNSDTEVLLQIFKTYGIDGIKKLNGMFAICLFDKEEDTTYLIRDQFGIKPLYYSLKDRSIYFSSEMKTLENDKIKISPDAFGQYFRYQFYLSDKTISDEINLLEPGYYLKIQNKTGQVKKIKYFSINFLSNSNTNDDINDLENKIIKSVEMQCFADVNIGSHLSGGIDSSLITAIASKFKKDLKAFHGYFPEDKKSYSEIEYAREVAKHLNIELFEIGITYEDFIENFKDIIHYLDYPIVGPGVFPQYMVNNFASQHVKVLLGGQGGDEIFAGYARYLIVYLEQVIHGSINETQINNHIVNLDTVSKALPTLKEYLPLIKKMWSQNLFTDPVTRYENILERNIPENWLSKDMIRIVEKSKDIFYQKMSEINEKSLINKMLHFDIKYILPGLLQVEDRVSMAHSLESRVPFLDQNVFNSAINLDPSLKFGQGVLKSPLKEISLKYLPDKVSLRKEKMGFPVPLNDWLNIPIFKEFVLDTIMNSKFANSDYFQKDEFEKSILNFETFDRAIWAVLCVSEWSNKYSNFEINDQQI